MHEFTMKHYIFRNSKNGVENAVVISLYIVQLDEL